MSGNFERLRGWSCVFTLPQVDCRLPPTYFWVTWHQTWAFLISMKNEKRFSGWFDNSEKGDGSGHCERLQGWSCGCTPPQDHCRLPPTNFWVTWHQTRAFLIKMNNEKWFLAGLTILKKETCGGSWSSCGGDPAIALHLRNAAAYRLPTFGSHGTKLGHSWFHCIIKVIFLSGLTI